MTEGEAEGEAEGASAVLVAVFGFLLRVTGLLPPD